MGGVITIRKKLLFLWHPYKNQSKACNVADGIIYAMTFCICKFRQIDKGSIAIGIASLEKMPVAA
jgi:hypothetical protein